MATPATSMADDFWGGAVCGAVAFALANLFLWDNDAVYQRDIDESANLCGSHGAIVHRTITSHMAVSGRRHIQVRCADGASADVNYVIK